VRGRRLTVVALFVFAAAIILLVAEHFAEELVASGESLGIREFLLVQWLAPLASEAPELMVAGLYAWRLNTNAGLGTLVSSKVNQWTLLVGTLPIAFALASSSGHGLPIDAEQRGELFLTAAQSAFAVGVLANLSMSVREASAVLGLFLAQFIIGAAGPASIHDETRIVTGVIYLILAAVLIAGRGGQLKVLFRDGFRTSYASMQVGDTDPEYKRT
jgi:cation:H+ antiporter